MMPGLRPLDYLEMLAVASRVLIIHGNYLSRDEIGLLSDHAESMAVVFCPRTHDYFGHDRYPLEHMLMAGVTVCLGTDSRASSPDLDLLAEIRHVARHYPKLNPRDRFATRHHRRRQGTWSRSGNRQFTTGKISPIWLLCPCPRINADDPYELLFDSDQPVAATWFRGKKI